MICIIHGYLLDGSGSNLWTRSVVQSLCRQGETIHLVCQEPHPETFDFISEARRYNIDGSVETLFSRDVPYKGRAVMHKPQIGDLLPVYVWDRYEEFSNVVPMVELDDEAINLYLDRNTAALTRIVRENSITSMHVNHTVLMSVAVERVSREASIPFAVMPHGSDIEYAVKRDERFLRMATGAIARASRVFVIGREMRERVSNVFGAVAGIDDKMKELNLGADTSLFEPIPVERRPSNIASLLKIVAGVSGGKSLGMSEAMTSRLKPDMTLEELKEAMRPATIYSTKLPDEDIESKLKHVDWVKDKIILFLGRIIASKGPQTIITALPLILEKHPNARLIVTGHGPLREPLEALLWALRNGHRALAEEITRRGSELEGGPPKELKEVREFFDRLELSGQLDGYFEKAERYIKADSVIFTGYLTHRELCYLFPCCDIAIFPSIVAEAGPLVFLEALASGCLPLGTYFAGMAASIDSVASVLPPKDAELMKLSADAARTVDEIARKASEALFISGKHKEALRKVAVEQYDWQNVARRLVSDLRSLTCP
ncbi:MAG TPA: glycosyltransferase [Blastocatellia bacterium]|nr:glycosyltransferase [Blastocatellia bacterium]